MSRRLAALLVAGLLLSACGSQSAVSAMRSWVTQSDFRTSTVTLSTDAHHAALALREPRSAPNELHTVCAVLLMNSEQANASLLTPDKQANNLASTAYTDLGAGANECYRAGSSALVRARALTLISRGMAALSEASVRINVATGRAP